MENSREESDQLPEDAPPQQTHRDVEESEAEEEHLEATSGVPNEEGQATGNPANAG